MLCITRYREEAREKARTEALAPKEKKEEGDVKKKDVEARPLPREAPSRPRLPGLMWPSRGPGHPRVPGLKAPGSRPPSRWCCCRLPGCPGHLQPAPGARPNGPGCPAPPTPATNAARVPGLWTPGCPASTAQAPVSTPGARA
ncbi:hypothetical protein ACQJBY_032420 [Aegilops geniculata]